MTTIRSQWRSIDPDIYYLFNKFSIVTEIFWVIGLTLLLNKLILHFTLICENKQVSISPFLGNKLSNLTILHKKYTYSWVEYHLRMLGVIKEGLKRSERVWHGKGLFPATILSSSSTQFLVYWAEILTIVISLFFFSKFLHKCGKSCQTNKTGSFYPPKKKDARNLQFFAH